MNVEIRTLFAELAGISSRERERYYEDHAVPDEVRSELESLILFDGGGTAIEDIIFGAAGLVFQEPHSDGDYCGSFRLLHVIGRGGMGVVYLAERTDGEVHQKVAVKLLRAALDSTSMRQRFLQERQILANLAHPNLARLIDAGHRADGQPYLVMEFIEGRPIDEHAASLAIRQRVELMATVCEAIAYAHQKLVVHRDLKPGNILVDTEGNPRVLDFGIAKLLDATDATLTVDRRLTPDYASPEQIMGAPATTATDVYSLGAVLYRLLTGEAPARVSAVPPSRLCPMVDRDLDAIILTAIRTEPHERYATADRLAEDLRAWVDRRPVSARQGERWYRARRQLRRHWALAASASIAASGLVAGLLMARTERDIAQRRFAEVRQLANQFFVIEKDIQGMPGSTAVRERIVGTSIKYLEGLAKQAGDDWRLKAEIAAGYRKAAEAQGVFRGINLGRTEDAQQSLSKAAVLLNEVSRAVPDDRTVLHDLIELVELQARVEYGARNLKALEVKLAELQGLLKRYESTAKDEIAEWQFLGKMYESMALSARELGRMEMPMSFARRSIELRRKAAEQDTSSANRGSLANAISAYAAMRRATGDIAGAVETYRQALSVLERIAADNPDHYTVRLNLANTNADIGRNLGDPFGPSLGKTDAAIKHFEESMRLGRRLMELDANERQIRFNHSVAAWRLGDALQSRDARRSLAVYDEAIQILRPIPAKRFSRDVPLVALLAQSTFPLRALRRGGEAQGRLQEANAIAETYRSGPLAVYQACRELISRAEAALALAQGKPNDAANIHRAILQFMEKEQDEVREDIHSAYLLTMRYRLLQDALVSLGARSEAAETDRKRRALVEFWKTKLPAGNNVEIILAR